MPQFHSIGNAELTCLPADLKDAIVEAELPELGEGQMVAKISEMLVDAVIADSGLSLPSGEVTGISKSQAALCLSGLWLVAGDLERSHDLSQNLPCRNGSFWHGIMHRREGDFGNAKYWFRKVGPHPVFDELADWSDDDGHDPFDFVDQCSHASRNPGSEMYRQCQRTQWAEWQALMMHCLDC